MAQRGIVDWEIWVLFPAYPHQKQAPDGKEVKDVFWCQGVGSAH